MPDFIFKHIDVLIDMVLAFITMSLGLSLSKKDFTNIITNPGPISVGLLAQMILHPLVTFALMLITDFPPEIKVGFVIISLCPGGATSNLVSFLLKGNVALSISLTVVNSLLCMLTLPFMVNLTLNFFINKTAAINLPVFETIIQIFLIIITPAILGIFLRSKLPRIAGALAPVLKYLLPALLLLIFMIKIFAPVEKGGIQLNADELLKLSIWVLILNFSGMIVGYVLGLVTGVDIKNKVTIIVEVGLQNTVLALFIAGNVLMNSNMQKPIMVYAMLTFFSTLFFGWLIKYVAGKYIEKKAA